MYPDLQYVTTKTLIFLFYLKVIQFFIVSSSETKRIMRFQFT